MSQINKRNIVALDGHNSKDQVIYLMVKTFRIRNNYSLFQAINYCQKFDKKLEVCIVEPYEINSRNLDLFHS